MTITKELLYLEQYYLVLLTHHDVLHKMIPDSTVKSKKLISLCQKKSTHKIFLLLFIYDNSTNGENFLTYFLQAIPSLILTFYCRKHTWLTGQTLCRQLMDHFMIPLFNLMNNQTTSNSKRKHAHKPTINSPASVSLRYLLSFVIKLYKLNFFLLKLHQFTYWKTCRTLHRKWTDQQRMRFCRPPMLQRGQGQSW